MQTSALVVDLGTINSRALNAPTGATPSNFGNLAFNSSVSGSRRNLVLSAVAF